MPTEGKYFSDFYLVEDKICIMIRISLIMSDWLAQKEYIFLKAIIFVLRRVGQMPYHIVEPF